MSFQSDLPGTIVDGAVGVSAEGGRVQRGGGSVARPFAVTGTLEYGTEDAIVAQNGARPPQIPRNRELSILTGPGQPCSGGASMEHASNMRQVLHSRGFVWMMCGLVALGGMIAPLLDGTLCVIDAWKNPLFKDTTSARNWVTGDNNRLGVPRVGEQFVHGGRALGCAG